MYFLAMYSNEEVTLTIYKESASGACRDYVLRFNREQNNIEEIISISSDVVKQLIDMYHEEDKRIKGRLVACVCYIRVNSDNAEDTVMYYHPSYRSEVIEDPQTFFITHMLKIAERMDNFNRNGSKLLIKNITEIHLHVTHFN